MSKLFSDVIGHECRIVVLGFYEIKGLLLDVDDYWIKFQYKKMQKIKIIKRCFVSSIIVKWVEIIARILIWNKEQI